MTLKKPAIIFKTKGKRYKTKGGYQVKYINGMRYIRKEGQTWRPSKYQDRNRNLAEMSDRGL